MQLSAQSNITWTINHYIQHLTATRNSWLSWTVVYVFDLTTSISISLKNHFLNIISQSLASGFKKKINTHLNTRLSYNHEMYATIITICADYWLPVRENSALKVFISYRTSDNQSLHVRLLEILKIVYLNRTIVSFIRYIVSYMLLEWYIY